MVQHEAHTTIGLVGDWLVESGVGLAYCHPWAGDHVPAGVAHDGLVVLGGAMSAWDDDAAPWLPDVRALLRSAVAEQVPTFAICLGGQLLAAACGGTVTRGDAGPEVGLSTLAPVARDAVFDLTEPVSAVEWHWDAITELPPDAELLLTGTQYPNQAFRVGACGWGVQFHPEAASAQAASWAAADAATLADDGIDAAAALEAITARGEQLASTWRPVVASFARQVQRRLDAADRTASPAPPAAVRDGRLG